MRKWPYLLGSLILALGWSACDDDDRRSDASTGAGLAEQTGQSCVVADDCYADVVAADIQGDIQCLDRVDGGYCTHLCDNDDDCCAVDGECDPGDIQVCGPFESTGMMMCFISCENSDIDEDQDGDAHCAGYHPDFVCRSTGGGSANRKVCVPGGSNGACGQPSDCPDSAAFCCENALGDLRCYDASGSDGRTCLN